MATMGGSVPPDLLARIGTGLGNNQMALMGLAGGLLGGQGFAGGFDRMAMGSKVDQSRQYLARELAAKKKKEEAQQRSFEALKAAIGEERAAAMGPEKAAEYFQQLELYKNKPREPAITWTSKTLPDGTRIRQSSLGQEEVVYQPREPRPPSALGELFDEAGLPRGSEERKAAAQAKLTTGDRPPSATVIKARHESQDKLGILDNMETNLAEAAELAPKAYYGMLAPLTQGRFASWTGMDKEGGDATVRLNQILRPEALKEMAATLKGASTEKEMQEYIDALADPTTTPEIKAKAIAGMRRLAKIQREILTSRVKEIEGGDYTGSKAATQRPAPQASGAGTPKPTTQAEWQALPAGARYIAPDGSERIKQ